MNELTIDSTFSNHITDLMNDSVDLSSSNNKNPSVGTKLEGLLLNSDSDSGECV